MSRRRKTQVVGVSLLQIGLDTGTWIQPIGRAVLILLANSVLEHVIPAKAGIQRFANISYVYIEDLYDGLIG